MKEQQQQVPIFLSAPQPCQYFDDLSSQSLFVDPGHPMNMATYGALLKQGFRRSGDLTYSPWCPHCRQCISARIPVDSFSPRRRHRRLLKANSDIELSVKPAHFNSRHYALYERYTAKRHAGGSMAEATTETYRNFLFGEWADTLLLEFKLQDEVLAVAVTDQTDDALSAFYTFFAPELPKRSLGTFAILSQIQLAAELGLQHLYLGYWIRDCQKMAYKAEYRPLEVFSEKRWRRIEQGDEIAIRELDYAPA